MIIVFFENTKAVACFSYKYFLIYQCAASAFKLHYNNLILLFFYFKCGIQYFYESVVHCAKRKGVPVLTQNASKGHFGVKIA
jgi:hypothetical protein